MKLYAIQATITRELKGGWQSTRSLPTFYLHPRVQGITGPDHAAKIARDIVDPLDQHDVSVTAVEVDA